MTVVVAGAGAAGLMAAIHAARAGDRVLVLERTSDGGRKILISGGGRCNVLPSELDPRRFVTDSSRHTMNRLLTSWPIDGQRRFFEEDLGIPLAFEAETGKLFPASDRAREVRDGLITAARRAGAEFRFGVTMTDLAPSASGWRVSVTGAEPIEAKRVILTTGGLSVPQTGSDGAGLEIATRLGHEIVPPYPALTPLTAAPAGHSELRGVSLPVSIRGQWEGETVRSSGGFLFTHQGYSGPAVLDVSHIAVRSRMAGGRGGILVEWGGDDAAGWEDRLKAQSPRAVATVLRHALPNRLADRLLGEFGIPADRTLSQLTRVERRTLVDGMTAYPLPWTGDEGYKKAEVTGGGVELGEVDPSTLESRRTPGLFLAGEILDAFGPIGGYNFAWAWATGRLAGTAGREGRG